MARTSREVLADALREIDRRLEEITRILVHSVDGQNEHRHHTRDQLDRLGTRVHELERRTANGAE
jgi:BMFP domain-containing protein YqiC